MWQLSNLHYLKLKVESQLCKSLIWCEVTVEVNMLKPFDAYVHNMDLFRMSLHHSILYCMVFPNNWITFFNVMLLKLPLDMWGVTIMLVFYLLNKVCQKKDFVSLFELFKGRTVSYKYFRVWGVLYRSDENCSNGLKEWTKSFGCIFINIDILDMCIVWFEKPW